MRLPMLLPPKKLTASFAPTGLCINRYAPMSSKVGEGCSEHFGALVTFPGRCVRNVLIAILLFLPFFLALGFGLLKRLEVVNPCLRFGKMCNTSLLQHIELNRRYRLPARARSSQRVWLCPLRPLARKIFKALVLEFLSLRNGLVVEEVKVEIDADAERRTSIGRALEVDTAKRW